MPKTIYLNSYLTEEQNDALLEDHSNLFVLTPDDIITLKLLRDAFNSAEFVHKEDPNRNLKYYLEKDRTVGALNRILKQVGG